jgi:hypothetical protein
MSSIAELTSIKHRHEDTLTTWLSEYGCKYIRTIFKESDTTNTFKRSLKKFADWSESKKIKEVKKFFKWLRRHQHTGEDEVDRVIDALFTATIRILLYNVEDDGSLTADIRFPDTKTLVYKCMKRLARYFYDNPTQVEDSKSSGCKRIVKQMMIEHIYTLLPLSHLFHIIDENPHTYIAYDFIKEHSYKSDSDAESNPPITQIQIEKLTSDDEIRLNYVPSDEIYNDYYQSPNEEHQEEVHIDVDLDVKHINLPVLKKGTARR